MMSKVEEKKEEISRKKYHRNIRWKLVLYDLVVYAAVAAILASRSARRGDRLSDVSGSRVSACRFRCQ